MDYIIRALCVSALCLFSDALYARVLPMSVEQLYKSSRLIAVVVPTSVNALAAGDSPDGTSCGYIYHFKPSEIISGDASILEQDIRSPSQLAIGEELFIAIPQDAVGKMPDESRSLYDSSTSPHERSCGKKYSLLALYSEFPKEIYRFNWQVRAWSNSDWIETPVNYFGDQQMLTRLLIVSQVEKGTLETHGEPFKSYELIDLNSLKKALLTYKVSGKR